MGAYKMRIEYSRFFAKLKKEHITQKNFIDTSGIGGSTLNKMRNNQSVTTDTLCRICDYFQCMPDEIMEWIPDSDYEQKRIEKESIKTQIEQLQEKLRNM